MHHEGIMRKVIATAIATAAAALVGASAVSAAFVPSDVGVSLTGTDGTFVSQAGSHPDLRVSLSLPTHDDGTGRLVPDGNAHDIRVDLPAGFTGNPTAVPTCDPADLVRTGSSNAQCPIESQIGVARIDLGIGPVLTFPVFNIVHDASTPGRFGINALGVPVYIDGIVRPGDYGISAAAIHTTQAKPLLAIDMTLWGVPADGRHDAQRYSPGGFPPNTSRAPAVPFLSNSTSCSDSPRPFTVSVDSWQDRGNFSKTTVSNDLSGVPLTTTGCERLPFQPTVTVQPLSKVADAPTGLVVDVTVPQSDAPNGLATAHVRKVVTRLPEGMSVSPSSAAGLGACSPAQIGLGNNDDPTCPDSSKLGSVHIDTPLLAQPLDGDVILAQQDDNPFHSLLALYIVAKGPGFVLKLPGRIDPDPVTGQLTATFDNTPQLPFSELKVSFHGGSQAPLATPASCGTYSTHVEVTSWASDTPVVEDTPMTIDQGCGTRPFSPSFSAGTANPAAGGDSPFSFTVTRADGQQTLSSIRAELPPGLLGRIASVPQCAADLAAAGTCPEASRVGSVAVLSGPGAQPLPLSGRVYLTGPHGTAPFGLSIVVPTAGQAGPFDLGNVVTQAGIFVDRRDAHVTVISDPLPTIIRGFPLRLRQIALTMDRPGFMFNPTSCASTAVGAQFGSLEGAVSNQVVRFQTIGCSSLDVAQKLALTFTGRSTTDGTHPGIVAKVTQQAGDANLRTASVKLPLSVALDPDNANALCTPEQRAALACPAKSIVGNAVVKSILPDPLKGPVYFVQGTRKSASGRTIKTLPKLWIPLSADGVTLDLDASSAVDSRSRLETTFDGIPDAPFSEFTLTINGGKHGIIVVSGKPGTCDRDKTIDSRFVGQNGRVTESSVMAKVQGCKPKIAKASGTSRGVTLRLTGIGAGRITVSGHGLAAGQRKIASATEASVVAKLTTASRRTLSRHGRLRVATVVRFAPKKGKAVTLHKTLVVKR